jgi:hypothetical protein
MTSGDTGPRGQVRGKPPIRAGSGGGATRAASPHKDEPDGAREATNPFGMLIF